MSNMNSSKINPDIMVRLTKAKLIEFIKMHSSSNNMIGSIDLNSIVVHDNKKLKQLKYQEFSVITSMPENLDKIFDVTNNKFLHTGVLNKDIKTNMNISLYSSVLLCLIKTFNLKTVMEQNELVSSLTKNILSSLKKNLFVDYDYKKYGWTYEMLVKDLGGDTIGKSHIKMLSDYLHINIIIADLKNDSIYYCDDTIVIYKKTIILLRYENNEFEPLISEMSYYYTCNNDIIKNILDIVIASGVNTENNEDLEKYKNKNVQIDLNTKRVLRTINKDMKFHGEWNSVVETDIKTAPKQGAANKQEQKSEQPKNSTQELAQDPPKNLEEDPPKNSEEDLPKNLEEDLPKNLEEDLPKNLEEDLAQKQDSKKIIMNSKTTLVELQEIAKKFNIVIYKTVKDNMQQKKKKGELIEEIKKFLN